MILCIVGPTGSGKSKIAEKIAEKLYEYGKEVEFVSADSRKVYKYFDIGTSKEEKWSRWKWWLIDILEPEEGFSAYEFETRAKNIISEVYGRGKIPIIVGGSWLYIRALELGLQEEPKDRKLREELMKKTDEELIKLFYEICPDEKDKINPNDKYRIIRAIEFKLKTGRSIRSGFKGGIPLLKIGFFPKNLVERISERTENMIYGLVEEVAHLRNFRTKILETIGYKEILLFLDGKLSLEEAKNKIISRTKRLARYQIKVFSRDGTIWFSKEEKIIDFSIKFFLS